MASSLDSLLASLRNDSISNLRVALGADTDLPALVEALMGNASVEEVNLDVYDVFLQRENAGQEILDLFGALGHLPKLQRLWVDSGGESVPFYTLPLEALARVLQQSPQLQKVALYNIELLALTYEEWARLEDSVGRRDSLQAFGIVNCRLAEETIRWMLFRQLEDERESTMFAEADTCHALTNLVGTCLANLPALQWVELTGQELDALGALTPPSLQALCQSTSLKKLELGSFDLMDEHIIAMSNALETNTALEEWKISCELGRLGCTAIAQMLFVNTGLKNFTLQLNDLTDNEEEQVLAQHIVGHQDKKPKNDPLFSIAQAMERNQSLQYFSLSGHAKIAHESQEAFAILLRSNTTLLNCDVVLQHSPALSEDLQREVDLMLKLNELGRKRLLQGEASPHEWVTVLWEVRRNLDGLFYLLSRNPMLCDVGERDETVRQEPARRPTYSGLSHLQFKYLLS